MNISDKKEMLKFAIQINLIMGLYNLYLYTMSGMLINLVIGSLNMGVWIFFRDVEILAYIIKIKNNKIN